MNYRLGFLSKKKTLTLDSALDACVQKDEERAKEFIYKKYYGYVLAVVTRYVKNEYDAEELVNETFIKAFKNLPRFNRVGEGPILEKSFRGWLARIAANLSIDLLRSQKNMVAMEEVGEQDIKPVLINASDKLFAEDILKLLERLPEIQRIIFNLYEVEGYAHEEIGKMLNIPDSTSRTYLTRAKQRLRKLYLDEFAIGKQ
ncbi:RNA polymerase sigma factor [Olivibacter sp. CPCC 100613]|uniref:RNA polymerase sigma factor n=1 Tax=Olivibacter sp. CPCC 100613 TaxID=3079931 RepID=UPI002FF46269